jgi:hypothetical protein
LCFEIENTGKFQYVKEFDEDFRLHFASDILEEAGPYYTMKMVEDERYHDKHVKSHDEVFSFIGNLVPRRENAFCLEII